MYRILIVDDMEIVRRELKRMPIWGEKSGFEPAAEARNGQEALERMKAEEFDLVITDIRMPKVDGLELLRKINEWNRNQLVVLLSDYSEFSFARQGIVLGAFDYLTKPADANELLTLLGRVKEELESRKREAERVKQMEEQLEEKAASFFPAEDVGLLINLMLEGNSDAGRLADSIVALLAAAVDNDPVRLEFLLKSILNTTIHALLDKKAWLKGFLGQDGMIGKVILRADTTEEIKRNFLERIGRLTNLVYRLECGATDNEIVKRMCSFVLDNLEGELSLKIIAENLYMSRTYLSELFRQKTGMQFVEYLTMVKMERAKILISDERLKTYEAAERLGFKDNEYFSRLFKKYTGNTPAEYRQLNTI